MSTTSAIRAPVAALAPVTFGPVTFRPAAPGPATLDPGGSGPAADASSVRAAPSDRPRIDRAERAGAAREVELSNAARTLEGQRRLLGAILRDAEVAVPGGSDDLFELAGRSDYLAKVAAPDDLSASATAGRILGGITGYIFGAFRLARGDLTEDDLEQFAAQARAGFEKGLGDAGEILAALGAPSSDQQQNIDEIRDTVHAGIERFIEEQRAQLHAAGA